MSVTYSNTERISSLSKDMYRIWQYHPGANTWHSLELASRNQEFLEKVLNLYVENFKYSRFNLEIREE